MADFWKASALVILAVILGTTIGKTEKDITVVLIAAVCCMVAGIAVHYLSDVISFLWQLNRTVESRIPFLEPLLKITGVAMLSELIARISSDAGNASLGKAMQILGNAAMLFLALPFFEAFYSTVQEILRIV